MERVTAGIYVASRASIHARGAMWRRYRALGFPIISTWIDEDGPGQTVSWPDLWQRIGAEIAGAGVLVLYAEPGDFPLKGAMVEVGIAIGHGVPIILCLPDVELDEAMRPLGSWAHHELVVARIDEIGQALQRAAEGLAAMDHGTE